MSGIIRLLLTFGKFALVLIALGLVIYASVWLLNKGIQWLTEAITGEAFDFIRYVKSKLPRIKIEKREDDSKPKQV